MSEHRAVTLFHRLRSMELPPGSFAVFGSGPLAAHGLVDDIGDLDVIVSDVAWDRLKGLGTIVMHGDDPVVDINNGLTFGRSWAYGNFDIEQLIEEAEMIDGLPFVRLEAVLEYKRIAGRPKDTRHIALLESAGLS